MTNASSDPWIAADDRIVLAVRVAPKASRTAVDDRTMLADGRPALGIRLAAPPVDGAANAELTAFLAKSLGLRRSDIRIVSGEASRLKRVELLGDPATLAQRLAEWIGSD
ncbi:DUF167 domain-containing protein [Sphingomonas tabacisoli]|uniref:UPF0235 protein ACFSCW_11595 n=1 Tax=Sphingomonas tabacisoli TaxID=2249466 RepID=A0ABW4I3E5_9SPHN